MVSKSSLDIVCTGQDCEAVLSGDQSLCLHGVQILADSDLGDAQMRREFGDFQLLFFYQKLQDLTGAVFFSAHSVDLPDEFICNLNYIINRFISFYNLTFTNKNHIIAEIG